MFAVEHSPRHLGNSIVHAQELITFSPVQTGGALATNENPSSSGSHPTHSESSNTGTAAPIHSEITRPSSGESSSDTSAHDGSNGTGQNGISMFKRYSSLHTKYEGPLS